MFVQDNFESGYGMTIGIYKLTFSNGAFYIGRSINIEKRFKDHCSHLSRNCSGSPKLQAEYNRLESLPLLDILEEASIDTLSDKEVYWIKLYDAVNKGLNVLIGGTDVLYGDTHPQSKYSNEQIVNVLEYLASDTPIYTHIDIEKLTKVKSTTIKDIVCGKGHTWLKEHFPDTYEKMLLVKNTRKSVNSMANLNPQANKKTLVYPDVISPNGTVYTIEHLSNFAKEHGLQASNLSHVLSGRRAHHKGWKLCSNG